jgi:predicted GNAT family N-acyltransferase
MEIRIIEHDSKDYEEMVALRVHVLLEPIGIPASYIDSVKEQQDILIGAFENKEMIGCCILSVRDEETLQLRQMAVQKGLQKKGVGASILQFAEEEARRRNYSVLMMHARDPVLGFYEKCGYTIVGEQFFEVGMPHHRMEKSLA